MAGLQTNNTHPALIQWRNLFISQGHDKNINAITHWEHLHNLGIPNLKKEPWKHLSLGELLSYQFISNHENNILSSNIDDFSFMIDAYRIVFINGHFIHDLSDKHTGYWKIKIKDANISKIINSPIQSEFFLHLTESLSKQIHTIILPSGKIENKPLYILYIGQGSQNTNTLNMFHYSRYINIEDKAHGCIIEHFVSFSAQKYFTGIHASITVGNGANYQHIKVSSENPTSYHFAYNDFYIKNNTIMNSNTFILGSKLVHHKSSTQLNGIGSELKINSLLLPFDNNIHSSANYLEHNKTHCVSRQLHKIIARNCGQGIFNGLIKVAKHAIKTDGKMINNNLLLDECSIITTTPQLEIYADDVKCGHGATIGKINEEQIFYLQSRGISLLEAHKTILYAFATEVILNVHNNVLCDVILTYISENL